MVASRISEEIDSYCQRTYDGGHRTHLGASLIGHECKRYLWYVFRWVHHHEHSGRMQRLFNRGHREEARFIEWLEGIGAQVWYENREGLMFHPESDSYFLGEADVDGMCVEITEQSQNYKHHIAMAKTHGIEFPQYRVSGSGGHFGGSLDAIIKLPERYGIPGPILGEFKTNGTGPGFNKLLSGGMQIEKPQHYAQTCTYGKFYNLDYALYMNINKNDDDIHVEIVKLDHKIGAHMFAKAEIVITSQTPPPRLSDNATFQTCKYCDFHKVCHEEAPVEKNCRSCKNAKPIDNAEWFCSVYNSAIPKNVIKIGCENHSSIANV